MRVGVAVGVLLAIASAQVVRATFGSPSPPHRSRAAAALSVGWAPYATPTLVLPTPVPVFLPLAITEDCPPANRFVAAVLVLDASPAMGDAAAGGESRLALERRGAARFVDGLRLGASSDRAGMVGFSNAVSVQALTASRGALQSALDALNVGSGMRLDLALIAGRAALADAAPGDSRALVLVVGGRVPNEGRSTALTESATLRRAGTILFVVNAGSPDEALLKVLAGTPARYVPVSDARLLPAAIGGLVRRVLCAPEVYWGRR